MIQNDNQPRLNHRERIRVLVLPSDTTGVG